MQHHAYIYEGALAQLAALAADARERFGFGAEAHPDVYEMEYEKFGIDESRELTRRAALRATAGHALFILGVGSITTEAQQALLKLFEEPQAGAVFVLLVPHGILLPTLRSRCIEYSKSPRGSTSLARSNLADTEAEVFLHAAYKARSAQIADLLKEEEGAKERARALLNALEAQLAPHIEESAAVREGLADIATVRSYLGDRSPSLKMLLEHLVATLPMV